MKRTSSHGEDLAPKHTGVDRIKRALYRRKGEEVSESPLDQTTSSEKADVDVPSVPAALGVAEEAIREEDEVGEPV